ncbi:MAG TPA: GIY-YIG nuclease family protein [Candidatus Ozemobacteraceae bacterium]|nr:GIY-YIG nuclease family protein [Candidatus Ozemobacteraceae bacterium]
MDTTRRKELKKAAKEAIPAMGVFQIRNTANGRLLIGSSMNLKSSSNSFQMKLSFFSNHNTLLKADLVNCGPAAFKFEILETIDAEKIEMADWPSTVRSLEKKWKSELHPYGEKGYNTPEL